MLAACPLVFKTNDVLMQVGELEAPMVDMAARVVEQLKAQGTVDDETREGFLARFAAWKTVDGAYLLTRIDHAITALNMALMATAEDETLIRPQLIEQIEKLREKRAQITASTQPAEA